MHHEHSAPSSVPVLDSVEDALDLRSVIAAALDADPVNQESLRHGVWTYVRAEHAVGTPPGSVILVLTELVAASTVCPPPVQHALTRQVILWCVEAYFGYLGGEVGGDARHAVSNPATSAPRIVSNR